MNRSVGSWMVGLCMLAGAAGAGCDGPAVGPDGPPAPAAEPTVLLRGIVAGEDGPVEGAVVRLQATDNATRSGPDGGFALRVPAGREVTITAWREGYYVGWRRLGATGRPAGPVEITLRRHYAEDNETYRWFSEEGREGSKSCGHCMPGIFAEWRADAHSRSAVNPRFVSMYLGTDVLGHRTRLLPAEQRPGYDYIPRRPDANFPDYGPGFKLDRPDEPGNCASCHVPLSAVATDTDTPGDLTALTPVEKEGISCEFCHKIGEVTLDNSTGLPYWHMPGTQSIRLHRPPEGSQLFFGTLDDVTRRVTRLPLLKESRFCAPCHWGMFEGLLVYNSFGEWYDSPYSDPNTGRTCQDCHMPPNGSAYVARPEKGGLPRPHVRFGTHRMLGASDEAFLQDTARLELDAERRGGRIVVVARVTNEKAGHHIPTDHPARQVLLVLSARDADGRELKRLAGPVLPDWAGSGDEPDDYAGRPGKVFAKVLEELWTGTFPTAAYWRHCIQRDDTRIEALATDTSRYEFAAPPAGPAILRARLIYRRAFKALARKKKWPDRDILMERAEATVPPAGEGTR